MRIAEGRTRAAVAVNRFADDLGQARKDARAAIAAARDADRAIKHARKQLTAARGRFDDADGRAKGARTQLGFAGAGGVPRPDVQDALHKAEGEADTAQRELGVWRDRLERAREDLERAQRRGTRAERDAKQAARATTTVIASIDDQAPQWVPPAVPALQPMPAPDKPWYEQAGDWFGGAGEDAGDWLTGAGKDAGNATSGFTNELTFGFIDLGGDKDSGAYKTGQVGSYVPWNPASAAKSLGTGAFKLGAKAFGKEAVEEGAEAAVKKNADEFAGSGSRGPDSRPSWRQSEDDVAGRYKNEGYDEQRSFKDGEPVPYGEKGSVRPELYRRGESIEVKNYDVESSGGQSNLVRNVSPQVVKRADNLPDGSAQKVVVDVRGQSASPESLDAVAERISRRTGGRVSPDDITFLR